MPDGSFERCFADELHVKRVVVSADHPFIIELPWGAVLFHANELTIVSTVPDPPGVRFCSVSGGLGKLSWNIGVNLADLTRTVIASLRGGVRLAANALTMGLQSTTATAQSILDLRQTEVVLMQGKQDEQFPGKPGGEFTLHLADPNFIGYNADKAMKRVVLLNSRSTEVTGGGAAGDPGSVRRFYSDDGRYLYNVQGDPTEEFPNGRIVQYDTRGGDDGKTLTAVAILRPEKL